MTLADRIVVLDRGVVQQVGSPRELYQQPANRFVARFIGTPSMNLARGRAESGVFRSGALAAPVAVPDGEIVLGVRVEDVQVLTGPGAAGPAADGPLTFAARVEALEPVGETGYLHLKVDGAALEGSDPRQPGGEADAGDERRLQASVQGHAVFGYKPGDEVRVQLRAGRVHAFHPQTGVSLRGGAA
jgi:ABC-type sugar transport system ATPase subunit